MHKTSVGCTDIPTYYAADYEADYERPIIADIFSQNVVITVQISIYPSKFSITFFISHRSRNWRFLMLFGALYTLL